MLQGAYEGGGIRRILTACLQTESWGCSKRQEGSQGEMSQELNKHFGRTE